MSVAANRRVPALLGDDGRARTHCKQPRYYHNYGDHTTVQQYPNFVSARAGKDAHFPQWGVTWQIVWMLPQPRRSHKSLGIFQCSLKMCGKGEALPSFNKMYHIDVVRPWQDRGWLAGARGAVRQRTCPSAVNLGQERPLLRLGVQSRTGHETIKRAGDPSC